MNDATPMLHWQGSEHSGSGTQVSAHWLSANDRPPPKSVVPVDDRLTADQAVKYASQGTAMLWLGDFHNARQLLSAIDRRLSKNPKMSAKLARPNASAVIGSDEFYRIRQVRAQRSRMLSLILVPLAFGVNDGAPQVQLPRAPHLAEAISFGYGQQPGYGAGDAVVSLQELNGVASAYQWYVRGVEVPSLGAKIHPHYGTFLPTRHEYVDLVARAPLNTNELAFDVGTGTGVLAAVLAHRGVRRIIGTDLHQRAVDCANENFTRLGVDSRASAVRCDMFPEGRAQLIVCNPPWLPGNATTTLDAAVYDPGSKMLLQFLQGLRAHLTDDGEGWLVLSDLAELLGLRTRQLLLDAIEHAGLQVVDRLDTQPTHAKTKDSDDPLHFARSRETTSLWRLRASDSEETIAIAR